MKVVVVGLGYVGLSNAILMAQHHEVIAVDIISKKVQMINSGESPLDDPEIADYLSNKTLNLRAITDLEAGLIGADYVILAIPTNYDEVTNQFDTRALDNVIETINSSSPEVLMIIKSTIPIGYIDKVRKKIKNENIIFSPEFLREGKALHDNLHPSRIIVGEKSQRAKDYAYLLKSCAYKKNVEIILTGTKEAESIKLFANSFLAMRVAFFNEIDSFALFQGLESEDIIKGFSSDPRIGMFYNNPSFGYGGYCLPKDTKQLRSNFDNVPQRLIDATIEANEVRKQFIADYILKKSPRIVGIFRLIMKTSSDNFRESSVQSVASILSEAGVKIVIFEPYLKSESFMGFDVLTDFELFKEQSDIIIANRKEPSLYSVMEKVFSRDLFGTD